MVISFIAWEGLDRLTADDTYDLMSKKLSNFGRADQRQCETNKQKTCGCQGLQSKKGGASFSFGCAWSMYHDGCKYARGGMNDELDRFRMDKNHNSGRLVDLQVNSLATKIGPLTGISKELIFSKAI